MGKRGELLGLGAVACALASLALAPAAKADSTVGQLFDPTHACGPGEVTILQHGVAEGNSYTVFEAGVITSWSFQTPNDAVFDALKLKVGRPVDSEEYLIVGESTAGALTDGGVNTFPASIPVQPGDLIGFYFDSDGPVPCRVETGHVLDTWLSATGDAPVGSTTDFFAGPGNKHPVQATVSSSDPGAPPSNAFSFGSIKRNRDRGTAKLTVNVPGPGQLTLSGKGLVKQRPVVRARTTVSGAGLVKLLIKSKGGKKRKLNDTGKVKVKAKVTFTPTGGSPNSRVKKVRLRKSD